MTAVAAGMHQSRLDDFYFAFLAKRDVQGALTIFADMMSAHGGTLMSDEHGRPEVLAQIGLNPESITSFATELGAEDPVFVASRTARIHDILTLRHCSSQKELIDSDFDRAVLRPSDIGDLLSIRVNTNGVQTGLSVMRDATRPFDCQDIARASDLYTHLSRCLRLWKKRYQADQELARSFGLTDREVEITTAMTNGLFYDEISDRLRMSKNTLKWHMKNIFTKCDVSNRTALLIKLR